MEQYSQGYSSSTNPTHNNNSSRRGPRGYTRRNRPTRNGQVRRSSYRRPRRRNNHEIREISLQFNHVIREISLQLNGNDINLNIAFSMMGAEPLSRPPVPFIGNNIPQPPGSGFVPSSTGAVQTHAAEQTLQAPTYDTQGQQPFAAFQGATAANNAAPVLRETHAVGPAATTPLAAPPTTTAIGASTSALSDDLLALLEGGCF